MQNGLSDDFLSEGDLRHGGFGAHLSYDRDPQMWSVFRSAVGTQRRKLGSPQLLRWALFVGSPHRHLYEHN